MQVRPEDMMVSHDTIEKMLNFQGDGMTAVENADLASLGSMQRGELDVDNILANQVEDQIDL